MVVGRTQSGELLYDYLLSSNLDNTRDPNNPKIDFSAYYKQGEAVSLDARDVPGYFPKAQLHSYVLGQASNAYEIV